MQAIKGPGWRIWISSIIFRNVARSVAGVGRKRATYVRIYASFGAAPRSRLEYILWALMKIITLSCVPHVHSYIISSIICDIEWPGACHCSPYMKRHSPILSVSDTTPRTAINKESHQKLIANRLICTGGLQLHCVFSCSLKCEGYALLAMVKGSLKFLFSSLVTPLLPESVSLQW